MSLPIGAIFALVYLIKALKDWLERDPSQGKPARPYTTAPFKLSSRIDSCRIGWSMAGGIIALILIPVVSLQVQRGEIEWLVLAPPLAVLLAPAWINRRLVVPLGWPGGAYWLAKWSDFKWQRDRQGGGLLMAARALGRQRTPSRRQQRWLEERLAAEKPLFGAGLAAWALLADLQGNPLLCRSLLEGIRGMNRWVVPAEALRLSGEWLAMEAAARGDWPRVVAIGRQRLPASFNTRLLAAIGAVRLALPEAPGRGRLWALWALASHPWATRPWVRQADQALSPAAPASESLPPDPVPEPPSGARTRQDPVGIALRQHARWLDPAAVPPSAADFARLVHGWESAFRSKALTRRLAKRAECLDGLAPTQQLRQLKKTVEADLAAMAREKGLAIGQWSEDGRLARQVADRVWSAEMQAVEERCDLLARRVEEKQAFPPAMEYHHWLDLWQSYVRAVGLLGPAAGYTLFPAVHSAACELAVWLYNDRKERAIAHAIFKTLGDEADRLGYEQYAALQRKNLSCPL